MRETLGDRDDALVALIVRECQRRGGGSLGRTAIQKVCYFAQALGVPLSHRFRIYYYGPYSDTLAASVDLMVADQVLVDRSSDPESRSVYRLGPAANALLEAHAPSIAPHAPAIERVAETFGTLDPATLEIQSTLHFVDRRLKATGITHPDRESVLDQFAQEKPGKFPRPRIGHAYDALRRAGLVG
jgi:hypothetical protein